ncbi:MAG: HAMP domain-containing histidine kinase [Campylobacterales bacterium]|nr:HAMP domain-containing histidine kinase [Campylobacterales bacterium]
MKLFSLKLGAMLLFIVVLVLYAATIFWYNYHTVDNAFKHINNKQADLTITNIKPMLQTQLTYSLNSDVSNQLKHLVENNEYIFKIDIVDGENIIASSDYQNASKAITKSYPLKLDNKELDIVVYQSTNINSGAYDYYLSDTMKIALVMLALIALAVVLYSFTVSMYDKQRETDYQELKLQMEKEAQESQRKTNMMYQQSRLAQMGEMISNIAHQWRQPLNSISLVLQDLKLSKALNSISQEEFDKSTSKIENSLQYMSNTFTDFRNFYKTNKEKEPFELNDAISQATSIVHSSFDDKAITINQLESTNATIVGFRNELTQVLVNILQNSKDALIKNNIEKPFVSISTFEDGKDIVIVLEDNAGGIKEDIIEQIFDPYFTTKHKEQGTGLGLYMSKVIINDSFNGTLEVQNTNDGAKFIIKIKENK